MSDGVGARAPEDLSDDDPRRAFSAEHLRRLQQRLAEVPLSSDPLEVGILAIACAYRDARAALDAELDASLQQSNRDVAEHCTAIRGHAVALQDLLAVWRPRLSLSSRMWNRFLMGLEAVAASAAAHVEHAARVPRGRRNIPMEWRDRLIATVYHAYPPGAAKKVPGSHFEETVGLLLQQLDPIPDKDTLHRTILRALDRAPYPYRVL